MQRKKVWLLPQAKTFLLSSVVVSPVPCHSLNKCRKVILARHLLESMYSYKVQPFRGQSWIKQSATKSKTLLNVFLYSSYNGKRIFETCVDCD